MERWKPLPGYEGLYEVSDMGNVTRTSSLSGKRQGRVINRPIRPFKRGPYLCFGPRKGNQGRMMAVHTAVLIAFVGPRPDGYEAGHRDGNPTNNRLDNLRWVTPEENTADKLKHGTARKTKWLATGRVRQRQNDNCRNGHLVVGDNAVRYVGEKGTVFFACRVCRAAATRKYQRRKRKKL